MDYTSTRNSALRVSAAQAILSGIARDGGLYVPTSFPQVDVHDFYGLAYPETAQKILSLFLTDYDPDFLLRAAREAYGEENFAGRAGEVRRIAPGGYALELWHGPTCAFKDYALQLMPKLLVQAKAQLAESGVTKILVATSGDTGKAALAGYAGLPGIRIAVFYPSDGTSEIQRLQMATQEGDNVAVYAVRGNFDDAQTGVKRAFADEVLAHALAEKGAKLSSANSINWGRLVPQIVYYFYCYAQLVQQGQAADGESVDFCVPTGNFGDILAGYYAKQMGLPVGRLICASNQNNVLTDFLTTGVYNARRQFHRTTSPSMDILVSSNLERLLYHVTRDAGQVGTWMEQLAQNGQYRVDDATLRAIRETFDCGCADDAAAAAQIGACWEQYGYLMDPHTAVAWHTAQSAKRPGVPCVVLSTASPYKFPGAVLRALGQRVPDNEFEAMHALEAFTGLRAPASLAALGTKPVRFTQTIEKSGIAAAALAL